MVLFRQLCAIAFASALLAQPPEDHFEVGFVFDHGRFVTNRASARITYKHTLPPGLTEAQFVLQLCDALDREFRLMPKPYFFTLDNVQKALDLAGKLKDPDIDKRRVWNESIRTFPELRILLEDRTNAGNFDELLEKVKERSAIAEWVEKERQLDKPQLFRLRPPLMLKDLKLLHLGDLLDSTRLVKMLAPIDGLPANPEPIRNMLMDFYTSRGLTPKIDLKLDDAPPSLSIFEAMRIARILLPVQIDAHQFPLAEKLVYESLPDRVFWAFRAKGRNRLNILADTEATKREIDLRELVIDAEPASRSSTFKLPSADAPELAATQQRLLPLKHQASLFDFKPEELEFDLVLDHTAVAEGAASKADPVSATVETPPNTPKTTSRPGTATDLQPSPSAPSPRNPNPKRAGNTPRRELNNFIGGGFQYRPGQGIRVLGSFQRRKIFGDDLLSVEAGGQGSGYGKANYSRQYVFFGALGRPLSIDAQGGTDFQRQRILDGVLTDERRTGAGLRFDLEAFRDRNSHKLNFFVEGRHETVRLTAAQPDKAPRPEVAANLNTIDLGLSHDWRNKIALHPAHLHIELPVRFGLALSATEPAFRKVGLGVNYHLSVHGPFEFETRAQGRSASAQTPVFELPSLGGPESVRGFRSDESVGRRLWSSQNEFWFPVLKGGAPSKFRDFVRRNVRLAAFYDLGGLYQLGPGLSAALAGFRQGAGLGLRVKYQGVIVEADWAYGFGSDSSARPGRGRFYFNFRLP